METDIPDNAPWIVAIDLNQRSRGALVFAAWLRATGGLPMIGVHVLEAWVRALVDNDPTAAIHAEVTLEAAKVDSTMFARIDVREADSAEDGLVAAAASAGGLVVGRAAPSGEYPRVRLGRVTRRLLRRLPGPVIVVPPDLTTIAAGPVLLATDLGPASEEAIWFARRFALRVQRPIEIVHVGENRHGDLIDELQPSWLAHRDQHRAVTVNAARAWAAKRGLGTVPRHVVYGDPVESIAAIAAARHAVVIVVGSRRLSTPARVFASSAASALSGIASCPVCVIPPAEASP